MNVSNARLVVARPVYPTSYNSPPWSLLDETGSGWASPAPNAVHEGDLLLALPSQTPEKFRSYLIKVLHPRTGSIGYIECGLLSEL